MQIKPHDKVVCIIQILNQKIIEYPPMVSENVPKRSLGKVISAKLSQAASLYCVTRFGPATVTAVAVQEILVCSGVVGVTILLLPVMLI